MSTLESAIYAANRAGRLATVFYTVMGYPSIELSLAALRILRSLDITIYETAVPLSGNLSNELSKPILTAHQTASTNGVTAAEVFQTYSSFRPNLLFVHEGTPLPNPEEFANQLRGRCDAVVFGDTRVTLPAFESALTDSEIDIVRLVSSQMGVEEREEAVALSKGFVYVQAAALTGAALLPQEELSSLIECVHRLRPSIPICCGYGIVHPADVRRFAISRHCAGIIVGTSALEALSRGVTAFEQHVSGLVAAGRFS